MGNIQKEKTRFFIEEDGHLVGEVRWRVLPNGDFDVNGTFVNPDRRGEGIAERLVLEVFKKAEAENVKILPSCSYVANYLDDHEEYRDLLI